MFEVSVKQLIEQNPAQQESIAKFAANRFEIAFAKLTAMAKLKELVGVKGDFFGFIATIAATMSNHTIRHHAYNEIRSIEQLVDSYIALKQNEACTSKQLEAKDAEIAGSFDRLVYVTEQTIDFDSANSLKTRPEQYHIYFTEDIADIQLRITGDVQWCDQCVPVSAKFEFKTLTSPIWSTVPSTNPEKDALLQYANYLVNHA